jgi:hypothetical protein
MLRRRELRNTEVLGNLSRRQRQRRIVKTVPGILLYISIAYLRLYTNHDSSFHDGSRDCVMS